MRDKLENFVKQNIHEFDVKAPRKEIWSLIEKQLEELANNADALEQFVIDNKDFFNNQLPNPKVWSEIDQQLSPPSKVRSIRWVKYTAIAASVVLLMMASALAGIYFYGEKTSPIANVNIPPTPNENAELSSELLEFEKDYNKRVNKKHVRLTSYQSDNQASEMLTTVNEDLSQVDKILNELRNEFKDAPKGSEDQIVNAMIRNYETKLKILEIVLKRIEKKKEDEGTSM